MVLGGLIGVFGSRETHTVSVKGSLVYRWFLCGWCVCFPMLWSSFVNSGLFAFPFASFSESKRFGPFCCLSSSPEACPPDTTISFSPPFHASFFEYPVARVYPTSLSLLSSQCFFLFCFVCLVLFCSGRNWLRRDDFTWLLPAMARTLWPLSFSHHPLFYSQLQRELWCWLFLFRMFISPLHIVKLLECSVSWWLCRLGLWWLYLFFLIRMFFLQRKCGKICIRLPSWSHARLKHLD